MGSMPCEVGGVKKSGRTARQLLMSKINQRRYRERERQKRKEMEGLNSQLDEVCAILGVMQKENADLRVNNFRLQSMIEEHQAIVNSLRGGIQGFPPGNPGSVQHNSMPKMGPADVYRACPSPQSMDTLSSVETTNGSVHFDATCHPTGPNHSLMGEMDAHVQAIGNLLDTSGTFVGGTQPVGEAACALRDLLERVTELTVKLSESKTVDLKELGGSGLHSFLSGLNDEGIVDWAQILARINLTGEQKAAIISMGTECMSALYEIHKERAILNGQAASLPQESSDNFVPVIQCLDLDPVWEQLKQNSKRENEFMAQALRVLFFNVLDLAQAAFLAVAAHPGGVDVVKLASAVSAFEAGRGAPAHAQPPAHFDMLQ